MAVKLGSRFHNSTRTTNAESADITMTIRKTSSSRETMKRPRTSASTMAHSPSRMVNVIRTSRRTPASTNSKLLTLTNSTKKATAKNEMVKVKLIYMQISPKNFLEPIEKTQVMEYNHKICFSMKPVRECPRNRYPTANKKDAKVQFGCLSRDSVQARRLLRQLKTENVLDEVRDLAPSFVETIKTPTKCVEL